MNKDVISGAILLILTAAYYWATLQIPDSSLSDEVGAQGLPRILAFVLAALAILIAVRGLVTARQTHPAVRSDDEEETAPPRRALGFLAVAVLYVIVAPLLGFGPALAVLIAAVAMYEGMRPSWRLAAVAASGALVFWLLFVQLLGVEQPASFLF